MRKSQRNKTYTLWISRWIAAARERIPGSIENYVTGVSECSQQRGNLKDDGYSFSQNEYMLAVVTEKAVIDRLNYLSKRIIWAKKSIER
ncbi:MULTISPECIES: hypothetical protein [Photorhabdus]|uniref:hypothetical protein n=1 Tax=Photorhabdus TaxID=29487 RepID=UPI00059E4B77|nr:MULTISPECIES: hypothetical protein [Photorhabdus]AWK44390.1 hypothetical protein A4R40_24370 [Photorhabdus laumondii subsp. laumondii]KTL60744.1 hypothetical protein AA106_11830 [Photorhabdus laumondii subsp. laumondii]NDK95979.1 hypothetical protein [Photorhabdus laumondii subsp. laumondii]NDL47635.1 hypothetical protein [Photorhabdus laumondii subsp. laumondii]